MIMKDTEKKSNLEPWFCECSVFVLTFVFALGFLFLFLFCFCATLGRVMGRKADVCVWFSFFVFAPQ